MANLKKIVKCTKSQYEEWKQAGTLDPDIIYLTKNPTSFLKDASVSNNVLTITKQDNTTVTLQGGQDISGKLDKSSTPRAVYGTNNSGEQSLLGYTDSATGWSIAQRNGDGNIKVGLIPTDTAHATSKKYVDDNFVKTSGDQTIAGNKTFNGGLIAKSGLSAWMLGIDSTPANYIYAMAGYDATTTGSYDTFAFMYGPKSSGYVEATALTIAGSNGKVDFKNTPSINGSDIATKSEIPDTSNFVLSSDVSSAATANKIVKRDGSGNIVGNYLQGTWGYFSQSAANEASSYTGIAVYNGNWLYTRSLANLKNDLGISDTSALEARIAALEAKTANMSVSGTTTTFGGQVNASSFNA